MSAPFDIPAPVVARADTAIVATGLIEQLQANPKPIVAIAAILALLVIALVTVFALRPRKQTAAMMPSLPDGQGYPELPASSTMQSAMQAALESGMNPADQAAFQQQLIEEQRRQIVLPPPPTTPEREQAIATVDQRPDAALRVTRAWLRQ
jgi:flagellar M-ring protein FliF